MTSVPFTVIGKNTTPPSGNPFPVFAVAGRVLKPREVASIGTGLYLSLPESMQLVASSRKAGLIAIHCNDGASGIVVFNATDSDIALEAGDPLARVRILDHSPVRLRFVEIAGGDNP